MPMPGSSVAGSARVGQTSYSRLFDWLRRDTMACDWHRSELHISLTSGILITTTKQRGAIQKSNFYFCTKKWTAASRGALLVECRAFQLPWHHAAEVYVQPTIHPHLANI